MKHILTLLLCLSVVHTHAQVQNGGFEDLNSEALPYYWKWISAPINVVIDTTGQPDSVVYVGGRYAVNDIDVHSGQRAMEIGNGYNFTTNEPYTGELVATYDTIFAGGFPINEVFLFERPQTVRFFAEYFPEAGDSAFVEVHVFNTSYDEIGTSVLKIGGTVATYTEFEMPITYVSNDSAATMNLSFHTSTPTGPASLNTRLLMDDVTVENTQTGLFENARADNFRLYPNPVDKVLTIDVPVDAEVTSVLLTDALGRTKPMNVVSGHRLDCSALANGLYRVSVPTSAGPVSKPFVVAH
jgi:hypothetical protein